MTKESRGSKSKIRRQADMAVVYRALSIRISSVIWHSSFVIVLLPLSALGATVSAQDFATLCADRAAIEHVYYEHRLGNKPPFEETLPRGTLERLVRVDRRKEAVLREHYGLTVTPAMLTAEVQRINTTTRAPEML